MALLACKNYRIIAYANSDRNAYLNLYKLVHVFNPFITKKVDAMCALRMHYYCILLQSDSEYYLQCVTHVV